jgi:hypothetical protein
MNEKNLSLARSVDFRQMIDNGTTVADEIEELVRELASKMQRIHGGEWGFKIDHNVRAIFIAEGLGQR